MKNQNSRDNKMDNTFDRLSGLEISDNDEPINHRKNTDLNEFLMAGARAPTRDFETYSELGNNADKDKVFNHSITSGLFRNINNSPLRERMPKSLQMYNPDPKAQFKPKECKKISAESISDGLDIGNDFLFNPKKFYCKNHPTYEVEYCNQISNNFYCK